MDTPLRLTEFVRQAVEHEREQCARIADEVAAGTARFAALFPAGVLLVEAGKNAAESVAKRIRDRSTVEATKGEAA